MDKEFAWKILDKYFEDNPTALVDHHLESYNDFFESGINQIFREKNPIRIVKQQDPETKEYKCKANLYLAGKDGNKIYYGKPIIFDAQNEHYMYPNEARLKNMTYSMTIHYDVDIEYFTNDGVDSDDPPHMEGGETISKVYLGKFPIMVQSDFCILNGMPRSARQWRNTASIIC